MAGFRPSQVVIGIAGELVKGFTTDPLAGAQEARRRRSPTPSSRSSSTASSARRSGRRSARSPGRPACRTWTSGWSTRRSPRRSIDGYAVTNPVGFQGRHVKIGIFNAFAPLVHLGALESVAAAARPGAPGDRGRAVRGRPRPRQRAGPAGRRPLHRHRRRHDRRRARPRTAGSRGRACSPSAGAPSRSRSPTASTCPFPRAEALKVDYARGLDVEGRDGDRGDRRPTTWPSGRRAWSWSSTSWPAGDLLPGADLPVRRRLAAPGDRPRALRDERVLAAPAVQPAAGGHGHGARAWSRRSTTPRSSSSTSRTSRRSGLAYQAIELQAEQDPLDAALRRVLRAMKI